MVDNVSVTITKNTSLSHQHRHSMSSFSRTMLELPTTLSIQHCLDCRLFLLPSPIYNNQHCSFITHVRIRASKSNMDIILSLAMSCWSPKVIILIAPTAYLVLLRVFVSTHSGGSAYMRFHTTICRKSCTDDITNSKRAIFPMHPAREGAKFPLRSSKSDIKMLIETTSKICIPFK